MSVKYACFPASDYLPEIEIDDTEIADYYDSNIDDYTDQHQRIIHPHSYRRSQR